MIRQWNKKSGSPFRPERGAQKKSPNIVHRIDDGQGTSLGFWELQCIKVRSISRRTQMTTSQLHWLNSLFPTAPRCPFGQLRLLVNQVSLIWRSLDYIGDDKWMTPNFTYPQFRGLYSTRPAFENALTIRGGIRSAIDEDKSSLSVNERDHADQPRFRLAVAFRGRFLSVFRALLPPGATRLRAAYREKDAGGGHPAHSPVAKGRSHSPAPGMMSSAHADRLHLIP